MSLGRRGSRCKPRFRRFDWRGLASTWPAASTTPREHLAEGAVPEISTIPVHDAVQAFGKALYGDAWIGRLTVPEARLLGRFLVPGELRPRQFHAILPGRVTYGLTSESFLRPPAQ